MRGRMESASFSHACAAAIPPIRFTPSLHRLSARFPQMAARDSTAFSTAGRIWPRAAALPRPYRRARGAASAPFDSDTSFMADIRPESGFRSYVSPAEPSPQCARDPAGGSQPAMRPARQLRTEAVFRGVFPYETERYPRFFPHLLRDGFRGERAALRLHNMVCGCCFFATRPVSASM